jgi:hypothetical protein
MPGLIEVIKGSQTGTIIALTEKGGCTSMRQTLKRQRAGKLRDLHQVREQQIPIRVYLRHPVKRLISAWRYFYPSQFPRQTRIPAHASFEEFVDRVLGGVSNEHWDPQLGLYAGCNIDELYQFERVMETWPPEFPLEHLNASHFSVRPPTHIPRQAEVNAHFREELDAWHAANSKKT